MTLHDWAENRWLHEHQTSRSEIADLLSVIDQDLEDASIDRLSADWRLGISYNAALQLANLALAASGYRTTRERSHAEIYELTINIRETVVDWMQQEHPDLLP